MSVDVPDEVRKVLSSSTALHEILVTGYVDHDASPATFQLFPRIVFFETDSGFMQFDSRLGSGQVRLTHVPTTRIPEDLYGEPSITPMNAALSEFFLGEFLPRSFSTVTLFVDGESDPNRSLFRGIKFNFEDGMSLVVDPAWTFGIQLRLHWGPGVPSDMISLSDELSQLHWRRS